MYQFESLTDTIAAIATAQGNGGIGIIRLSGDDAIAIAAKIFKSKNNLLDSQSHTINYGWIIDDKENIIDEVLVLLMRTPNSYTTQDVVEIHCHGGTAVVRAVLELCLQKGARLAAAGEFTKRAFLNGRIDLAQAESVLDIIQAKTEAFVRVSQHQLTGELSIYISHMRSVLMNTYTMIEAVINFPEDDISADTRRGILNNLQQQLAATQLLLDSSNQGRLLKEGIRIVLCGKPNVGKSSLLNALLKQQRAIVTDIAGTTRDAIEETAHIHGVPFALVDTAGILEPRDLVEKEAIKRSHLFIDSADLVLLIIDMSRPLDEADFLLFEKLKDRHVLVVGNKSDLAPKIDIANIPFNDTVMVSALKKDNISALEDKILSTTAGVTHIDSQSLMITNIRHVQVLTKAHDHLNSAITLGDQHAAWEIINDDIKRSVNFLDAITGRDIDSDLIDEIFSKFCIGK